MCISCMPPLVTYGNRHASRGRGGRYVSVLPRNGEGLEAVMATKIVIDNSAPLVYAIAMKDYRMQWCVTAGDARMHFPYRPPHSTYA